MSKNATLYRMETDDHICPYGLKSKDLLRRRGYDIEDHTFDTKAEADAFREKYEVKTTPQTFIDGERVGGYDDLRAYFGKERQQTDDDETTYQPVIAVFAVTLMFALATVWRVGQSLQWLPVLELFIAFSMSALAILKLRDLYSFSNQFITYDLLAMKWVPYAYIYPFIEALAGVAMITAVPELILTAAPLALFIGTVGGISVFKAVYLDQRELKCACVGGNSNVPLGFISLAENVMMAGMAVWMLVKHL